MVRRKSGEYIDPRCWAIIQHIRRTATNKGVTFGELDAVVEKRFRIVKDKIGCVEDDCPVLRQLHDNQEDRQLARRFK